MPAAQAPAALDDRPLDDEFELPEFGDPQTGPGLPDLDLDGPRTVSSAR